MIFPCNANAIDSHSPLRRATAHGNTLWKMAGLCGLQAAAAGLRRAAGNRALVLRQCRNGPFRQDADDGQFRVRRYVGSTFKYLEIRVDVSFHCVMLNLFSCAGLRLSIRPSPRAEVPGGTMDPEPSSG